jgi:hypothetical protein
LLSLGVANLEDAEPAGRSWPGGRKVLADVEAILRDPQLRPPRVRGSWYFECSRGSDFEIDESLRDRIDQAVAAKRERTLLVYTQPEWLRGSRLGGMPLSKLLEAASAGPKVIELPTDVKCRGEYRSWRDRLQFAFD